MVKKHKRISGFVVLLEASNHGVPNERVWFEHMVEQLSCVSHEAQRGTMGHKVSDGEAVLVEICTKEVDMQGL